MGWTLLFDGVCSVWLYIMQVCTALVSQLPAMWTSPGCRGQEVGLGLNDVQRCPNSMWGKWLHWNLAQRLWLAAKSWSFFKQANSCSDRSPCKAGRSSAEGKNVAGKKKNIYQRRKSLSMLHGDRPKTVPASGVLLYWKRYNNRLCDSGKFIYICLYFQGQAYKLYISLWFLWCVWCAKVWLSTPQYTHKIPCSTSSTLASLL